MNNVKQENKFYRTSTAWKMSSCIAYTSTLPSLVYASCKVVYEIVFPYKHVNNSLHN